MYKIVLSLDIHVIFFLVVSLTFIKIANAHDSDGAGVSETQEVKSFSYPVNYYFPNTEILDKDEMRIIALGTGSPAIRKAQAASSFLVELGNGEKFMFDVGTGSQLNFAMLEIPYGSITALFLSHLHVDHTGELPSLWIASWLHGRLEPFQIYGPSGLTPDLGTAYFIEHMQKMFNWDISSRRGKLPDAGTILEVYEFDHSKTHVIYEKNGVKITSWPAIHALDGAVSYRLDWNGLSFVYSGDTSPNKWFVENSQDADLIVHETFYTVNQMVKKMLWDRKTATLVATRIHTVPSAAGRIFSMTKPRLAVGFHNPNDFDTSPETYDEIRKTYKGPFILAQDMMVFNVTSSAISVRVVVGPTRTWTKVENPEAWRNAKRTGLIPMSDWYKQGILNFVD